MRGEGQVTCGSVVRPGLAVPSADGRRWQGLAVEICRAVAAAALGRPDAIAFHADLAGDRRALGDPVGFVTDQAMLDHGLIGRLEPGPVVLVDAEALLVPAGGAAHRAELAGRTICVEPGTAADRALERVFAHDGLSLAEHPFQESDEMRQAYGDGRCDALAGPMTTLANLRADPTDGHPADRILPELLALEPVRAATPAGDPRWSALVAWTVAVLVDAEAEGDGAPGVPPAIGRALGLDPGWAARVTGAVGSYGAIYERTLGHESRLKLARGPNRLWRDGGLIYGARAD